MKLSPPWSPRPASTRRSIKPVPRCILLAVALFPFTACGDDTAAPEVPPPDPEPPPIPAEATAWIESNSASFDGSHLSLPRDDISFLRDIVGDARIVSLGENTHGTRDFFEMRARILRFLVEEMDFDAFVIEATWPEANRLDRYVREGKGDADSFSIFAAATRAQRAVPGWAAHGRSAPSAAATTRTRLIATGPSHRQPSGSMS